MTISAVFLAVAERILGSCEVTAVLGNAVVRVRDARGQEFVVKQHGSRAKHDREVHAYQRWTAALGSSSPRIIAADSTAMAIVITALPGEPCSEEYTTAAHHQAGALLRRLHDAEPPRDLPWFPGWLDDRVRHWTSQADNLLSAEDHAIIDGHLSALARVGVPRGVPCHLDFQPRNWLLDTSGNLALIDFEHARTDLPARDFVRLRFRVWASRPDLREAFFVGYGRRLTDAEDEVVWHLGALDALTALARGRQTGDPALITSGHATLSQLRQRQQ
ncbi:MAG: phosphotransferase enzyme family protein [Streptosporangiaceae bacterium]